MVNPLITVIVTTFNRKVLLKRAPDSVINQTYQNIEIILVDDCSSDRTEEFIKSYKENYNNIFYFRNDKNRGLSYSRNYALSKAKGEFITHLDDDKQSLNYTSMEKNLSEPPKLCQISC